MFVGAESTAPDLGSFLSTVLFTDVVGSTEKQAALGDRRYQDLIEAHHAIVRDGLSRWQGAEWSTAGDGFYATFDGPARPIHCARVAAMGGPSGVLVSQTVKDLAAGSGLSFEDAGEHN